jgi:hypothetical protein
MKKDRKNRKNRKNGLLKYILVEIRDSILFEWV